jgi:hypothetical protein
MPEISLFKVLNDLDVGDKPAVVVTKLRTIRIEVLHRVIKELKRHRLQRPKSLTTKTRVIKNSPHPHPQLTLTKSKILLIPHHELNHKRQIINNHKELRHQ